METYRIVSLTGLALVFSGFIAAGLSAQGEDMLASSNPTPDPQEYYETLLTASSGAVVFFSR